METRRLWTDRVLGFGEMGMQLDGVERFVFLHRGLTMPVARDLAKRCVERVACVCGGVNVSESADESGCTVRGLWDVRVALTQAEARVVAESDVRVIRGGAR